VDRRPATPKAFLIDHDLGIFHARREPKDVEHLGVDYVDGWTPNETAWIREDKAGTWKDGIDDWARLLNFAEQVRRISDTDISSILEEVPPSWRDPNSCRATEVFLRSRRDHIGEILEARRTHFPVATTAGEA
jgi:hypothetical protein